MSAFTATYLLVALVLVFAEGLAIGRRNVRDTISGHVWRLRASGLLVWPLAVLWIWMTCHFLFPWEPDGSLVNDAGYLVAGFVVAYVNVVAVEQRRGG